MANAVHVIKNRENLIMTLNEYLIKKANPYKRGRVIGNRFDNAQKSELLRTLANHYGFMKAAKKKLNVQARV